MPRIDRILEEKSYLYARYQAATIIALNEELIAERANLALSEEMRLWGIKKAVRFMAQSYIERYGIEGFDLEGINARFMEKSVTINESNFLNEKAEAQKERERIEREASSPAGEPPIAPS